MHDSVPLALAPPAVSTIRNVGELMSLGWFLPAPVQRSFEWDESNAIQLLNDIDKALSTLPVEPEETIAADAEETGEEAAEAPDDDGDRDEAPPDEPAFDDGMDESAMLCESVETPPGHYFIGNIILNATGPRRYEVYDGLQRLTTLTILIAVLRDLIADEPMRAELDGLIAEDGQSRLALHGRDKTLAEHVQAADATGRKSDNRAFYEIGRRILGVKNALRESIETWDEARRLRYARFLLSSVWTSVLDVRDVRLARQMFVSTNLYGKQLEPIDLLKGQIADMISQSLSTDAVDKFGRDWEAAKQVSGAAFEEMLKAVDAIERTDTQDKTWPTELAGHLARAYPGAGIERFLRRLGAYARTWKECKRLLMHAGDADIERSFWRLHVFWWPEWHGLALRWWRQVQYARRDGQVGNNRWRRLQSRFDRLHRRCMGITLAQLDEADRQRIFIRAMQQDKAGADVFQGALAFRPHQRRKIDRTLRTQIHRQQIWAPLLRWIEIAEWRDGLPELIRTANTEHVRPRRPDLRDDRAENARKYNDGCFSLGNLAIISREGNELAGNRDFADKLDVLRREADAFTTMRSVVYDTRGAERTQWTNAEINERADMLRGKTWRLMGLTPPAPA